MQTAVPPYVMVDGVHEAVLREVPQTLIDEILPEWEIRFELPERACLWFDDQARACRHYEYRPQACRDFELNSTICHAVRQRWQEKL